jgi:hypothetical protein
MILTQNDSLQIMGFWRFPDDFHQVHGVHMPSSQALYLPRWRISRPEIESHKLHVLFIYVILWLIVS